MHSYRVFQTTIVIVALASSFRCFGVSLIAGAPNGESTPESTWMIAHESQVPIRPSASTERWLGFSFFTYGLGSDVELASTIYNLSSPASRRIAVSLGYKWTPQIAETSRFLGINLKDIRWILGQEFPVAIQGNEGPGHWSFAGFSFRLESTATRFTFGPSFGTRQIFGKNTFDAFWGIEQPIANNLAFLVDGFTGRHDLGAVITAVQWDITHQFTVISGMKWNTSGKEDGHAAMVEITYEI